MKMTHERPTVPGWYWAVLPGSRPLQPVLVYDGSNGLEYTFGEIGYEEDDERSGLDLDVATGNFMWSDSPIVPPPTTANTDRGVTE